MKRWFGCIVAASALAVGGASGCFKSKEPERPGSVWRASNDYGDKPGNGIELIISEQSISSRFFILEPADPHNFDAGLSFPLRILQRRLTELRCEVSFNESQTDRFALTLPESLPEDQFVSESHDSEPGTAPIEFVFKRVK